MKFRMSFKDPDGVGDAICDAAAKEASKQTFLSDEAQDIFYEDTHDKLYAFVRDWLKYGEYVSIEFDTEAGTATVVKNG